MDEEVRGQLVLNKIRHQSMTAAISAVATVAAPVLPAKAQTMPGPWGMHDGAFGWWPLGGLIWLLLIGLAVVGVIAIMRGLFSAKKGKSSGALKVLDERYARGEIDREEYLQRRKDLVG